MLWGATDLACRSYDPAVAGQPAIPYSAVDLGVTAVADWVAGA